MSRYAFNSVAKRDEYVLYFSAFTRTIMHSSRTKMQKIHLYTLSTCSHCLRTKKFFRDQGIEVEFTDVDLLESAEREKVMDEVRKLNPDCTFPTICIGDHVIIGFNEGKIREALRIK
jgi:glutaredoxin-like protein NrdH